MKHLGQTIRPSATSSRRNDRGNSYKGHTREGVDMANIASMELIYFSGRGVVKSRDTNAAHGGHRARGLPLPHGHQDLQEKDAAKAPTRQSTEEREAEEIGST